MRAIGRHDFATASVLTAGRRGGRRGPPTINGDAPHLPRQRAAAASATWQYLLLETSRKLVWTVPASAREHVYGPSVARVLALEDSRQSERSRRATSCRRSLGESRRAASRSFSRAPMAMLAPLGFYPRGERFPTSSRRRGIISGAAGARVGEATVRQTANREILESEADRGRIALSHFCYRRRKALAPQRPRKLPKLDVAGSTPVARSS